MNLKMNPTVCVTSKTLSSTVKIPAGDPKVTVKSFVESVPPKGCTFKSNCI